MKIWEYFSSARSEGGKDRERGPNQDSFKAKKQNVTEQPPIKDKRTTRVVVVSNEKVIFRTRLFAPRILSPSVFETLSGHLWHLIQAKSKIYKYI